MWAEAGLRRTAAQLVADRMNDVVGHLQRSRNKDFIPFSQAVKGVSFLYFLIHPTAWHRERSMRQVVGRQWATKLLTIAALMCALHLHMRCMMQSSLFVWIKPIVNTLELG